MPRTIISGDAGDEWTNDTGKPMYQLIVAWHNSCGVCIAKDHQIAAWWACPFHRGCNCRIVPVFAGMTAAPFVDYRQKITEVSAAQQANIMGRANLTMVESGLVSWDDVVTSGRIRTLREVASRRKLTVDQMVKAGVHRPTAQEAFDAVNTGEHTAAEKRKHENVAALVAKGYAASQIHESAAASVAGRVTIGKGPSGPTTPPPIVILPVPKPSGGKPATKPASRETTPVILPVRVAAESEPADGRREAVASAEPGRTYRFDLTEVLSEAFIKVIKRFGLKIPTTKPKPPEES